jgi:chromate transporter
MEPTRVPGIGELFIAFLKVSLSGFGGVLAFAHRMIVEQRRWLTEQEFMETLGLCQVLPGPNIGNLSVYIGARFHGWRGALAAFSGLILAPFFLVLAVAGLYGRFGDAPGVSGALAGVSAASAGLLAAMAWKMARRAWRDKRAVAIAAIAFAAVGLLRLPLPLVLVILAPSAIAVCWKVRP